MLAVDGYLHPIILITRLGTSQLLQVTQASCMSCTLQQHTQVMALKPRAKAVV
jgi:hypothetical protein